MMLPISAVHFTNTLERPTKGMNSNFSSVVSVALLALFGKLFQLFSMHRL
jgi:hypothetical protein